MNKFIRIISSAFAFLLIPYLSYAQIPKGIPDPMGPIDFSKTSNVIIFAVIPAIVIIAFFIFRKRIIKIKREKRERTEKPKKKE